MKIKNPTKEKEIEKAILMMVDCVRESCCNPKPLILHSLRVGIKLFNLDQPKETVIAGILHDLIEDTDCRIEQIKRNFGSKVANLVSACSYSGIEEKDYKACWHKLINNIKNAGEKAMLIKLVDADDNLSYVPLIKNPEKVKEVLWKHQLVINSFEPRFSKLKLFQEYQQKYQAIAKKIISNRV